MIELKAIAIDKPQGRRRIRYFLRIDDSPTFTVKEWNLKVEFNRKNLLNKIAHDYNVKESDIIFKESLFKILAEIIKSEFIAEIQSRGKIDLSKISIVEGTNKWYRMTKSAMFPGKTNVIFYHNVCTVILPGLDTTNPPVDETDIFFMRAGVEVDKIDEFYALARIDELPFIPISTKTVTFKSVPSGAPVTVIKKETAGLVKALKRVRSI